MQFDVAVVIPFFQREAGILEKALASVMAQQGVGAILVLVADDASPVPATPEVEKTPTRQGVTVKVLQRPNGGPAAARNTALANVPEGTRHVAFLDSDDEWSADHLSRAIRALSEGFDFYFADLMHLGQTTSAFKRAGRIVAAEHTALGGDDLFAYRGDMFDQIMCGNVIGTSTVVFDRMRFADIRFREEYYSAGEDYLCWMDFASRGARFAFSLQCEARYGRGVNVYSGAQWGTARHLERVHNEFKYRCATQRLHKVTPAQEAFLRGKKAELRGEFAGSLMHMVRCRMRLPLRVLSRQVALDPASAIEPLALLGRKLGSRFR
jgi:succinoglycan biosynthesis protein ExoW